jgi:hypothetical protein
MSGRTPDRLGDAIRELARTMAEHGKYRIESRIVTKTSRAIYELRLLQVVERRAFTPRRLGVPVIEVEAFGPEPSTGSRQMADHKKE